MKVFLLFLYISASLLQASAQVLATVDCADARDHYADLNDHLLADRQEDADVAPEAARKWTQELTGFITQQTLARLADAKSPGEVRAYLACLQQSDGDDPGPALTNTPQVFFTKPGSVPLALTTMLITRGGMGTLPLVQCFARHRASWTLVATGDEHGFDDNTLYIQKLRSPISDESWYFLSGQTIGATGGDLHLEVVSCGARGMRTVWERSHDTFRGEVEVVNGSTIKLTYSKQGDPRVAELNGDKLGPEMVIEDAFENEKRFSETLRVTRKGLEPVRPRRR